MGRLQDDRDLQQGQYAVNRDAVPAFLSQDLLDRFEARVRAVGAQIVDAWAPGLADERIDALLEPMGIELPEEARVWWRWHNGFIASSAQRSREITPARWLMDLETAADEYAYFRDPMRDAGNPEGLLSPVSEKPTIYFRCAGPKDAPVLVYSQNDYTERPRLALSAIGDLILTWISYIDRGVFAANADGTWVLDPQQQHPPDVRDLGVA